MLTEKYPPEGSNISRKFTPRGVTYTWPTEPRSAFDLQYMGLVFYLIFVMFFLGFVVVEFFIPGFPGIEKGIDFGHLFIGFLLLLLLYLIFAQGRTIYFALRRPLPASLELTPSEIIYRTGTKRPQLKFVDSVGKSRVGISDEDAKRLKSKTYALPIMERENFTLERIGDYLLLSFKYRGESIEINNGLNDSDKEWLYKSLKEYK